MSKCTQNELNKQLFFSFGLIFFQVHLTSGKVAILKSTLSYHFCFKPKTWHYSRMVFCVHFATLNCHSGETAQNIKKANSLNTVYPNQLSLYAVCENWLTLVYRYTGTVQYTTQKSHMLPEASSFCILQSSMKSNFTYYSRLKKWFSMHLKVILFGS